MKHPRQRIGQVAACLLACLLNAGIEAQATDLPTNVLNYLRQKDPNVQVRFDGLIRFSNGERYMPVIPQDPSINVEPQHVISNIPEKTSFPDLIEFDNHFFLIRLIQTVSGRLTFPKMEAYPIQLKEGLLPQDLVLPNNLFIPVELKVILGALPYNPSYVPPKPTLTPGKPTVEPAASPSLPQEAVGMPNRIGYVFDIPEQKLFSIHPITGMKQADVPLNCAPSALQISPDGKLLFASCLSTNELVVVDTAANLVKNRIAVGQRPDAILYLPTSEQVWISNRYSSYLSVIDATSLLPTEKIELPGPGGALALFPGNTKTPSEIVVADAAHAQIYVINPQTRQVTRTLPAIADISAMTVIEGADNRREIWVASRTENQVLALDAQTGTVLAKLSVARKPVALTAYGDKMYVLCAGDARVNVISTVRKMALEPIVLEENTFPSGMMAFPLSARAYISSAGADKLVVLNLKEARVENSIPVNFRASLIAFTPEYGKALPASSQLAMPTQPSGPNPENATPFAETGISPVPPAPPLQRQTRPPAMPLPLSTKPQTVYRALPKKPASVPGQAAIPIKTPSAAPVKATTEKPAAKPPASDSRESSASDKPLKSSIPASKTGSSTTQKASTPAGTTTSAQKPVAKPLPVSEQH